MTWKFSQIEPQKARGKLVEAYWDSLDWIAEEKFDGDRRISQFCASGLVRFTGSKPGVDGYYVEKTDCLPHLSDGRDQSRNGLPPAFRLEGTVLDGEMVIPPGMETKGGKSKYVTSIMGSRPEVAIRKQRAHGYLGYVVFDCLWFKGRDIRGLPLRERYNYRNQAVETWGNAYAKVAVASVGQGKRALLDDVLERGGEGVVLKRYDHLYGDESLWVKVKYQATADVVVMGYNLGKGKYAGKVGAIIFGQNVIPPGNRNYRLRPYGTCRGFDDELMDLLTKRSKQFTGKVFRIKHNGREPTGAFRHPQFDGWRPDKSPKDCVYREDET